MLLLRLRNSHISLPFSNLSTGLRSTNAFNINFFLLPTKFLQSVKLAILTIWSLFNPLAVPAPHLLLLFLAHQPSRRKAQIAHSDMHYPVSEIDSFIPSASPVVFRLTSSFACQFISVIIIALIIHHSFTLSLQAQNLPFQQILPTLILFLPWTAFTITGPDRTYHASRFIFSSFFKFFCLSRVVATRQLFNTR